MSKKGYFYRYFTIITKIEKQKYITYEQLASHVDQQIEQLRHFDDTIEVGFSQRTLQRDIKEISQLFNIDIKFDRKQKGYYIVSENKQNYAAQRMLAFLEVFNTLNLSNEFIDIVYLENREPQNTYHFSPIIESIKHKKLLQFSYMKFNDSTHTIRTVTAYGLKEYKNRWYLLAVEKGSEILKIFALDRMFQVQILSEPATMLPHIDVKQKFEHAYGISLPIDEHPEIVELYFSPLQREYVKSLPLHQSQQIISDDKEGLVIQLNIYITPDFVGELLSFGPHVKVIKPNKLVKQIKEQYKKALSQYD